MGQSQRSGLVAIRCACGNTVLRVRGTIVNRGTAGASERVEPCSKCGSVVHAFILPEG